MGLGENAGPYAFSPHSSFNSGRSYPSQQPVQEPHNRFTYQETYGTEGDIYIAVPPPPPPPRLPPPQQPRPNFGTYGGYYYGNAPFEGSYNGGYPNPVLGNSLNGGYPNESLNNSQSSGYPSQRIGQYYAERTPYGHSHGYDHDWGSQQEPHGTFSASSSESSTLPPTGLPRPQENDYIKRNKQNLKNPPKKSYKVMFGRKKELGDTEEPLGLQRRRSDQSVGPANKGSKSPLKPVANQGPSTNQPMTTEDFWKRRAENLERQKQDRLAGANKKGAHLKKYPTAPVLKPEPQNEATKAQSFPEPGMNQFGDSPRVMSQPVSQTVYTEDGQRVSVDINLKLLSPPPAGGPKRPDFPPPNQGPPRGYGGPLQRFGGPSSWGPPPIQFQQYEYRGPTDQFSYRAPVMHPPALHSSPPAWGQVSLSLR